MSPRDHPTRGAIVVGVDEADVTDRSLAWAAQEAVVEGRPLVLLHATGPADRVGESWWASWDPARVLTAQEVADGAAALLRAAASRVASWHPGLEVRTMVSAEDPCPELVLAGRDAHLLVLGSRGHGLARVVPTHQVGAWVAHRAACPVVVVPEQTMDLVRQGVLAGDAFDEGADRVLAFAFRHASAHGLTLTVAHVGDGGAGVADEVRRLAASVSGQSERFPDVRVALRVLPGRPTARLLRVAERMDLLVVGRHRGHGVREVATGHVHTSIVDRVACPVAVVP